MKVAGLALGLCLVLLSAQALAFDPLTLKDPTSDDKGPGTYVYPTATDYEAGSFDITQVEIKERGDNVVFTITYRAEIKDPWKSKTWTPAGQGFSLQFAQIYVDRDHKARSGHEKALPGINVLFAEESWWDKVILVSPQPVSRQKSEVTSKAKDVAADVIVPKAVTVKGKTLTVEVPKSELGTPDASWGWQVVSQSNEGYPDPDDLLTRDVNEVEGEHRFGGGNDWACDPHAIDILAGEAKGGSDEKQKQYDALKYTCAGSDLSKAKLAVIPMVYPK